MQFVTRYVLPPNPVVGPSPVEQRAAQWLGAGGQVGDGRGGDADGIVHALERRGGV